jgi:hypothetical protein
VFVVNSGPKGKPADEKDDVLTFRHPDLGLSSFYLEGA